MAAEQRTRRRWRTLSTLGARFLDLVSGLETLRAFGRERAAAAAIDDAGERYRRETMATLRIGFLSALVLELLATLGTALVAVTVGVQLASGSLGLEAGLAVLILAPELYAPLRELGAQYPRRRRRAGRRGADPRGARPARHRRGARARACGA